MAVRGLGRAAATRSRRQAAARARRARGVLLGPGRRPHRGRPRTGRHLLRRRPQTWEATLFELASGEATGAYHYQWCRETWALVVGGRPTLRHADGETVLSAADVCCFPQGPGGARQLRNDGVEPARLIAFSAAADRPMSTFYPDEDTVLIQFSEREGLLFRHDARIEDYWDGEPGAM